MTAQVRALRGFSAAFGAEPSALSSAPGRVNLIGEHTDYNEGWVLPAAIDRRAWVAASACPSHVVTIHALDLGAQVTFRLTELDSRLDLHGEPLPGWARYPAGVAWALQQAGVALVGLDATLASDVPIGAGLSSSAAVEGAIALAWLNLSGIELDRLTVARSCQKAENEYVGVQSGLMDQFTALHAREGHALLLDCRSLAAEHIRLPSSTSLVMVDSGVRHALGESPYNVRRQECAEAARRIGHVLPEVRSLRDVAADLLPEVERILPAVLMRRTRHVVQENARVLAAATCLERGDMAGLGSILNDGHASLRDLFEVSHPDVDTLVDLAQLLPGCYGARLTGGGFGGSTVNLVEVGQADLFAKSLTARYGEATGRDTQAWVCRAGRAAEVEGALR